MQGKLHKHKDNMLSPIPTSRHFCMSWHVACTCVVTAHPSELIGGIVEKEGVECVNHFLRFSPITHNTLLWFGVSVGAGVYVRRSI